MIHHNLSVEGTIIFNPSYEDYGSLFTRLNEGTIDTWPAKKELEACLGTRIWREQHSYRRLRTHVYTDTAEAMGLFKAQHPWRYNDRLACVRLPVPCQKDM